MTNEHETVPDEALAARAAGGDRAAFNALIGRYKDPLYRFVRRYIGEPDDAYDVLQDTFISAWMALGRYNSDRPFRPWIRTIALNKCRDFGRRQTVRRTLSRILALESADPEQPDLDPLEMEDPTSSRLARLDRAIADLPALYKEPLLLTMVERLSQDEAAKVLKTSRKAIEMRLYRARQRLAAILDDESEG